VRFTTPVFFNTTTANGFLRFQSLWLFGCLSLPVHRKLPVCRNFGF
jgi:hypothetical protein